jgi:predicted O-linked N-acetylglucosamine transferase (SPINDLY family)
VSDPPPANSGLAQLHKLIAAHDYAAAQPLSRSLLQSQPDNVELLNLHSFILLQQGKANDALEPAQRAAALAPTPHQLVALARARLHARDPAGALDTLDQTLAKWPDFGPAWASAVDTCMSEAQYLAAAQRAKAGLEHCPSDLGLAMMLSLALESASHTREAVDVCRAMLPRFPTSPTLHGTIAYLCNYLTDASPAEVFEAHRKYGRLLARHRPAPPTTQPFLPREGRRLRIGFISPDFREHSVAYFISPFFKNYDKSRFELFAYYTRRVGDEVTEHLRSLVDHWRTLINLHPDELAKSIRADRLDLLIELAGHTGGDSLEALHLRPAARHATYIGYPNTTGLPAINFRIVDSITDPPGADQFATEKLIRLDPCFLCYTPPTDTPPIGSSQSEIRNSMVFCSFNALRKINEPLIALWSRVLKAAPGSKLLLKCNGLGEPAMCDELRTRFAAHAIAPDRLEFLPPVKQLSAHLAAYARADIALDTFPYHGTTTTCEALWMGIPVITLRGNVHSARVGASLLSAVGLPNLIAESEDDYVRIANTLANDRPRLDHLRANLRTQMAASSLCDATAFCRRFGAAVEIMLAP